MFAQITAATFNTPGFQFCPCFLLHSPSRIWPCPTSTWNTSWFQDKLKVLNLALRAPEITPCLFPASDLVNDPSSHIPCDSLPQHLCFCEFPPSRSSAFSSPQLHTHSLELTWDHTFLFQVRPTPIYMLMMAITTNFSSNLFKSLLSNLIRTSSIWTFRGMSFIHVIYLCYYLLYLEHSR